MIPAANIAIDNTFPRLGLRDLRLSAIFASDLRRTASALSACKGGAARGVPIKCGPVLNRDLRSSGQGSVRGAPPDQIWSKRDVPNGERIHRRPEERTGQCMVQIPVRVGMKAHSMFPPSNVGPVRAAQLVSPEIPLWGSWARRKQCSLEA